MARKRTTKLPSGCKREEMRQLEKELRRSGYRLRFLRRYGRRILNIFIIVLLLASIGWCARYIWENYIPKLESMAIRKLEFHSNGIINQEKALQLMDYDPSENLFTIDTDEMEERLLKCSAIRKAVVQVQLPSTLYVNVDVRIPVAWVHCPGAGLRSHDLDHGVFIDSNSYVFGSIPGVYENYIHVPVLEIPLPSDGEIRKGEKLPRYESAVQLIDQLSKNHKEQFSKPRTIRTRNEWSYEVEFDNGCIALFGVYDIPERVEKYYIIVEDALKKGRKIARINLTPHYNIAVTYDDGYEEIPLAVPVEEE